MKPAVFQTYAEFGFSGNRSTVYGKELDETIKTIRKSIADSIPPETEAIGRADFILGSSRESYITYRIWIDQLFKTLDTLNAEEIIDKALSDVQMINPAIYLQVGKTFNTLTDEGIQVPCSKCRGGRNDFCANCDEQAVEFSTEQGIVLINQAGV
jgi:hypothetical protein